MIGSLIEDPRPSLTNTVILSDYGDSEVESEKSTCEDSRELEEERCKKVFSRSISQLASDSSEQKLGWPLLCRANTDISLGCTARHMSVVQWVMSLPDRSPQKNAHLSSIRDTSSERDINSDIEDESYKPKILSRNWSTDFHPSTLNCKWFSLEVLKSCTCQFSSG